MAQGIRRKDGEKLSKANIDKVIELLNADSPITKKAACEILVIAYNTTRLNKIIEGHIEDVAIQKSMRKKMRTIPIDNATAGQIVSCYLSGDSLADISEETYRSTNVIKNVLRTYNIPVRNSSVDYFNPIFIEKDEAITDDYLVGDLVYSARYDCPATVRRITHSDIHGKVFSLWTHGVDRKQIVQPYYELADLRKVQRELKISMYDLDNNEVKQLIYEGLRNQKKQLDKRK